KGKGRRTRIGNIADPKWTAKEVMDCIHLDLIGPTSAYNGIKKERIPTYCGYVYSLQVTEEKSRVVFVFPLKHKSDAAEKIIQIIILLETQTRRKLRKAHSDGGGEFVNDTLKIFFSSKGIEFTYTTRDTP